MVTDDFDHRPLGLVDSSVCSSLPPTPNRITVRVNSSPSRREAAAHSCQHGKDGTLPSAIELVFYW
jgi:hypothetical protein